MAAKPRKQLKKHGYEFFGPLGSFFISFILPIILYSIQFICNDVSGCPAPSLLHPSTLTIEKLKVDVNWKGIEALFNVQSLYVSIAWYGWSLVLYAILPAQEAEGVVLASGGRLKYRFNAFPSAIVTLAILCAGTAIYGADWVAWRFITDNYIPLYTANLLLGYLLAIFVFVRSFSVVFGNGSNRELAAGGHTGNILYDWFIGRELNPRIKIPFVPEIDIKIWMEMRTGLLGWTVLNLAFVIEQYRRYGYVTASILVVTGSQGLYVLDALYMEPAILTTIDIISDGFGFMLAFADTAWIPFSYSLQARYLAIYPLPLGSWVGWTFSTWAFGYHVFRASNNEKNRFRTNPRDPAVSHLKYMETKSESKLLTSGWWGRSRHPNYLGDWIMSWAFCLPTGFAGYTIVHHLTTPSEIPDGGVVAGGTSGFSVVCPGEAQGWGTVITYFYLIYFAVLLLHRAVRDDEKCAEKYGQDWEVYKKKVPYKMVPFLY